MLDDGLPANLAIVADWQEAVQRRATMHASLFILLFTPV
jgi:hypothetical protein